MRKNIVRHVILMLWAAGLVAGCSPQGERCRKCGMLVKEHPRWVAGAQDAAGQAAWFCCPRCLFAHMKGPQGGGMRGGWVTEYYSQERMPLEQVLFVAGSDLTGPMGKALVPVKGQGAAERFMKDHHGTAVLKGEEITVEVLKGLAGK